MNFYLEDAFRATPCERVASALAAGRVSSTSVTVRTPAWIRRIGVWITLPAKVQEERLAMARRGRSRTRYFMGWMCGRHYGVAGTQSKDRPPQNTARKPGPIEAPWLLRLPRSPLSSAPQPLQTLPPCLQPRSCRPCLEVYSSARPGACTLQAHSP